MITCWGCAHCGCDPTDIDGYCVVCDDCDDETETQQ